MKAELNRCYQLIADGFSLITIGADKRPNILWKEYQTKPMNKDTFTNFYQMPKTEGVGVICGFENIEVIDIKCIDLTGRLHHISLPVYPDGGSLAH